VMRTEKSGTIEFCLEVKNGIILNAAIYGDYFSLYDPKEIEDVLANIPHQEEAIRKAVSSFNIQDYFAKLSVDEFLAGLF
jgi:lipoate---protein ligase